MCKSLSPPVFRIYILDILDLLNLPDFLNLLDLSELFTLGFLAKISFTPLLYHPVGCLGCPEKQTSSRNYDLFVWSAVFQPKWNCIQKNLQKISKSTEKLLFFRIFSEFVQFWLENSGPNQLDELKLTILLLLTPKPSLEAE
jgi:hypothetical protein